MKKEEPMGENQQEKPAEKWALVMATIEDFQTLEVIFQSQVAYLLQQAPAWMQATPKEQAQSRKELEQMQNLLTRLTRFLDGPVPSAGTARFDLTPEEARCVPEVLRAFSDRVRATSRDTPSRRQLLKAIEDLSQRMKNARRGPLH